MGKAMSKFNTYIQNGDENAAMQIYKDSPELKIIFDANLSYGEAKYNNTAMHYAARYGMKELLKIFLNDLEGNPNVRNSCDETPLHCACSAVGNVCSTNPTGSGDTTVSTPDLRAACISLLLRWRQLNYDVEKKVEIDALNKEGNSALHLAAGAGLATGVLLLVSAGAKTFTKDIRGKTAAQRALASGHTRLAALIEKAMLFSEESIEWCSERWRWTDAEISEEQAEESLYLTGKTRKDSHVGLCPGELKNFKNELIEDTSGILKVSFYKAEALLRDNEWCKDALVGRWIMDSTVCCESAGVSLPGRSLDDEHPEESALARANQRTIECGICQEQVPTRESEAGGCGHIFCIACWHTYLTSRVHEGIPRPTCPATGCRRPVSHRLLQRCLTPNTEKKYFWFDVKAFVENSRGIKWCPVIGCDRAVMLQKSELDLSTLNSTDSSNSKFHGDLFNYPKVSRGVDCGDFHFFCWECNSDSHPPISCEAWSKWISLAGSSATTTTVCSAQTSASTLWQVVHCKNCPSCSSPIQKVEGCNHVKCFKCQFKFCWSCMSSLKSHNSHSTECIGKELVEGGEPTVTPVTKRNKARKQWRFALHCARYRLHEQRWLAERPFIVATPAKARDLDPCNASGGVLEAAARELGLSRRMLMGCCPYLFFLPDTYKHVAAFCYAQEELERCTFRLAALIACEVIEAPLLGLKRATAAASRWRLTIMRLVRPPAPMAALSAPELRLMARYLARGILDPKNPWRMNLGLRGKPLQITNIRIPDYRILEELLPPTASKSASKMSKPSNSDDADQINVSEYKIDLIIALEMSRLQMLQEMPRKNHKSIVSSTSQEISGVQTERQSLKGETEKTPQTKRMQIDGLRKIEGNRIIAQKSFRATPNSKEAEAAIWGVFRCEKKRAITKKYTDEDKQRHKVSRERILKILLENEALKSTCKVVKKSEN